MNDSRVMDRLEAGGDIREEIQRAIRVERPEFQELREITSVHQPHHDEKLALLKPHVVNRYDVGMLNRSSNSNFLLKPRAHGRVARESLRQELDRDRPLQRKVSR